ncbi:MAG: SusC/RagA family TonB-linked outer membrane protein [Paludibacter sp.]|nr:SusC/RagA family TonB-linked outer membrane protein [Paludibacter sp.]
MNHSKLILLFLLTGFIFLTQDIFSQKKVTEHVLKISSTIVDPAGNAVRDAVINAQEGKVITYSDNSGKFMVAAGSNDDLLIEAAGFESRLVRASEVNNKNIVLMVAPFFLGEKDKVNIPFGELNKRRVTGAVTEINVNDIEDRYSAWNYASLLKSEGFGLIGSNNIRGNGYTIIIDGFVRDGNSSVSALSDLINVSEIDKITVLKDVTSRLLYGSLSDAGILMITTRRGEANKRKINVKYEGSAGYPLAYPKYLGAADYMYLYNEALLNDGLPVRYTDDEIKYTKDGIDPVRYPDQDYYSNLFLRKTKPQHRVSAEFSGGNNTARYYLNFGWYNTNSMQTMGVADNQATNRFNVRGAVDVKVNDYIKVNIGALAYFNAYHGANYKNLNFWNLSTSERPNAYPFLIPIDRIVTADRKIVDDAFAQKSVIDNQYLLGGTSLFTQNIYGDLLLGGYSNTIDRNSELNIGIDINLSELIDGLTFKSYLGYDNYNAYRISQNNLYAIYEPTFMTGDSISVKAVGTNNFVGSQSIGGINFYRRLGWSNTLNYTKKLGDKHDVNVTAMSLLSTYKQNNFIYTEKALNFGLRANYIFDNKYVAEVDGMLVASPRFSKENRWGFSPAVGLGWIISEEDFLKSVDKIDFLKLKASYGNTKTDYDDALANYYLYQNVYNVGGTFNYGDGIGQNNYMNVQTGNQNISWVQRNELNAGIETSLFNKVLFMEVNYFHSTRFDEIQKRTNTYPQFMGGTDFIAYENYAERVQQGFEADLRFTKQFGDFRLSADFNIINLVPIRTLIDELDYGPGHEYRQRQGKVNDAIWGLVADGLYTQDEIDKINDPLDQTVSKPAFGGVKAGDIKYVDLDNNNIIDENDTKAIGNTQPRFNYGLRLTIDYKNLSLFVFGAAETGYHRIMSNSYNWVYGEMKYPAYLVNRWAYNPALNVDTRATATYPRLTTKNNTNNFRNSTFWLTERDYFSIPAIQLTYAVPHKLLSSIFLKQFSVYARVDNLLTLSKDKYATLNVGSSPQLRMYNIGIKAGF